MPVRKSPAIAIAHVVATGPAAAASPSMPVSGVSLAAAAAVALIGLVFLASGLSRLSGASGAAPRFRFLGPLGRLGAGGVRSSENGLRRAVTSILIGTALLCLPDLLGAGVTSQLRTVYLQSHATQAGYVGGSEIKSKETSRAYSDTGRGIEGTADPTSFPWWLLGVASLFILIAATVRLLASGGVRSSPTTSRPSVVGPVPVQPGEDGFLPDSDLRQALECGGVEAASAPTKSIFEILFETIERIQERIRVLLKTAREQLRRLADETEEQKGRFRPLAAFAVQQAASLFRALADRDDGGSGLPPAQEAPDQQAAEDQANSLAYAERIGSILSLQGSDLVGQIAKALAVPRKRVEADLHRLGATGAPSTWIRVVNVDAGREWILAEHHVKVVDRRFEGVVRLDQVDWFATLSVQERPSNLGLIVIPLPAHRVYLVSVRDGRAEELANAARERLRLPEGGSWTLADLPLERIARHFGDGSDGRWIPAPDGPPDEILVFDVQAKRIVVASGTDRLHRALASEETLVRALIHVRRGAALASLGITIADVVPQE